MSINEYLWNRYDSVHDLLENSFSVCMFYEFEMAISLFAMKVVEKINNRNCTIVISGAGQRFKRRLGKYISQIITQIFNGTILVQNKYGYISFIKNDEKIDINIRLSNEKTLLGCDTTNTLICASLGKFEWKVFGPIICQFYVSKNPNIYAIEYIKVEHETPIPDPFDDDTLVTFIKIDENQLMLMKSHDIFEEIRSKQNIISVKNLPKENIPKWKSETRQEDIKIYWKKNHKPINTILDEETQMEKKSKIEQK
jgi:uncharacterized beta-barrel protein YwiB (DUF1934 family)